MICLIVLLVPGMLSDVLLQPGHVPGRRGMVTSVCCSGCGTRGSVLPKNKPFMGREQGCVKVELCELSSRASLGGTEKLKC